MKQSAVLLCLTLLLGGCAAPVVIGVGSVATGAAVATDRRTAGTMLDDQRIEMKTGSLVADDPQLRDSSHVNATSFNGILLLTGEVPDEQSRTRLEQQAARLPRVSTVKNELVVGPVSESSTRARDTATTARLKTRLVSELGAGLAQHIKVVTESGTVYLMGMVNRLEAAQAVEVARYTSGIQRIVKVFEYQDVH